MFGCTTEIHIRGVLLTLLNTQTNLKFMTKLMVMMMIWLDNAQLDVRSSQQRRLDDFIERTDYDDNTYDDDDYLCTSINEIRYGTSQFGFMCNVLRGRLLELMHA